MPSAPRKAVDLGYPYSSKLPLLLSFKYIPKMLKIIANDRFERQSVKQAIKTDGNAYITMDCRLDNP